MLLELLQQHFDIEEYCFDHLEKNVEYITGATNIVKLGENPKTLKHNHDNKWSDDVKITDSYKHAIYYRLDKMDNLCKNALSGSWSETYNFNKTLENS